MNRQQKRLVVDYTGDPVYAELENAIDRLIADAVSGPSDTAFLVGDVVKLNSGGPAMTVTEGRECDDALLCNWFVDEDVTVHEHFFRAGALKAAKPQQWTSRLYVPGQSVAQTLMKTMGEAKG